MGSKILKIKGAQILSRENQRAIRGSGFSVSECGCSCSGSVTGPFYCFKLISCPQVYTCDETM